LNITPCFGGFIPLDKCKNNAFSAPKTCIVEEGNNDNSFNPPANNINLAPIFGVAISDKFGAVPINKGDKILYLGIASGTTASHISDIIDKNGLIFGVDISARILRDLVPVLYDRKNIIGILADADKPWEYLHIVTKVDLIYQDVAQPHQVKIFIKNIEYYLKNKGYGFLAVKARSIDVSRDPKEIFKEVRKELEDYGLRIIKEVRLEPYHIDHSMFLIQNK